MKATPATRVISTEMVTASDVSSGSKRWVGALGGDVTGGTGTPTTNQPLSISDRELWACAQKMLDRHGRDAELHAAMRADELLSEGDLDGQRVWKAILARIVDWRRETLPPLLQ